jgi:hypothetical protein
MFNKVFYNDTVTNHKYCKILRHYFETGEIELYKSEDELIKFLIYAGNLQKHVSFKHECEVRITTTDNKKQYGIEYDIKEIGNIVKKVLILKPEIMGHDKGTNFENLIEQVIIGPRSQQNIKILQEYICAKGLYKLAGNIIQSECPLR